MQKLPGSLWRLSPRHLGRSLSCETASGHLRRQCIYRVAIYLRQSLIFIQPMYLHLVFHQKIVSYFLNSLTCYKFLFASGPLTEYKVNSFIRCLLSTEQALYQKDTMREHGPGRGAPELASGSVESGLHPFYFFFLTESTRQCPWLQPDWPRPFLSLIPPV